MSYDELEQHNVFLPEKARGEADLHTTINQPLLLGIMVFGAIACGLMWWGGGYLLTWIGAGCFLLFMLLFTLASNAGIDSQNEQIDELIEQNQT